MSWIDISWLHLSCLLTDVHSRHKSYCQQVIMIFFWRMHILQNNSLSIATIMELELRRPKKCTNESMLCCCAMYTMWLCIRVLKANNIFFYNVQMTYFTKFFMYNTWKILLWCIVILYFIMVITFYVEYVIVCHRSERIVETELSKANLTL